MGGYWAGWGWKARGRAFKGRRDKWGAVAHYRSMGDSDMPQLSVPPAWALALERADSDLAAGRLVPASQVHALLREAIEEMEAETTNVR